MTGWMVDAACAGADTALFFLDGEKGRGDRKNPPPDPHWAARAICARCPVVAQCLQWATDNREYGFAGGMTEAERNAARRRKQRGSVGRPNVVTPDDDATRRRLWQAGLSDVDIAAHVGRQTTAIRDCRKRRMQSHNKAEVTA